MNIGLLISELEDKEVKRICVGASQAANDKGVSLVIMPGKYIDSDKHQYSALFDYANTSDFDAIVVDIERIGKETSILRKEAFLKKFDKVPVLTLTETEGFQAVNAVETDHDQFEQLGYEAVCDAIFFAKNGVIPPAETAKNFTFVEQPDSDALSIISELGFNLFHKKYETEKAHEILAKAAVNTGINNFGIYLYDKKVKNTTKYPWNIPETISVKSTVVDGSCATFSDGKLSTETDKIFSSYTQKKTTVLLTGAIFVGDYQLGILITEYNPRMLIDHYFESFQGFVTAISRLSYLEKELLKTTEELYEVQEELARDDSVLDHIGDQDYLTGGLNRRGFFAKAYDLLKEEFKPGKFAVVSYIHMESLKGINDIYGHDEGDRAVKKVAKVLQDVFGDSLCGRIRGDEFAVIEITDEEGKSEAIIQEMSMQNGKLLADSPRYINHLQYAICEFSYDDNLSLREMLKETDENLQRIKGNII